MLTAREWKYTAQRYHDGAPGLLESPFEYKGGYCVAFSILCLRRNLSVFRRQKLNYNIREFDEIYHDLHQVLHDSSRESCIRACLIEAEALCNQSLPSSLDTSLVVC